MFVRKKATLAAVGSLFILVAFTANSGVPAEERENSFPVSMLRKSEAFAWHLGENRASPPLKPPSRKVSAGTADANSSASSLFAIHSPTIAQQLGWVTSKESYCGGYYLDQPFVYPVEVEEGNSVAITGNRTLFSQRSTSLLEGRVTITRYGQQITANQAYVYRNPVTFKLSSIDLIGNVHLREPNSLIVGKTGHYNFETNAKSLLDIFYRTSIYGRHIVGPKVAQQEMEKARKITGTTAWGKAYKFSQEEPQVFDLTKASYSTCPPTHPAWRLKANHIVLNKKTGRGYATHVSIYVKKVPVFYFPYINFPIDSQRKSGFLYPTIGFASHQWGPYLLAPFYWNMAPNYDMTITPSILSKRGLYLIDDFRYLTETSEGKLNFSILTHDRLFADQQHNAYATFKPLASNKKLIMETPPTSVKEFNQSTAALQQLNIEQAELNRLINASTSRKGFYWRDTSRFNDHWSSDVDFNYASDDYYMRDFGNLNEITQNQLLQKGDLYYKNQNWNFTGRVQAYQTLHPVDTTPVENAYRRFPQLILNADYPDQKGGLEYFINNEVTYFTILDNPGISTAFPVGNRLHTQPGISLPLSLPYFYINPRAQLALTDYNLYQTNATNTPTHKRRAVPIFDIASGLAFNRYTTLFNHVFDQTLEPQLYYTYIPYRNQASIPTFDTTVNMLTYDQIFNYNRFTGIDRIGDANQIGLGVATRLIDQESGLEKVTLGVGEIIYFADRRITLCNNNSTTVNCINSNDKPNNPNNHRRVSPLSGMLTYAINPNWSFNSDVIWNPTTKQLDNSTVGLRYQPDQQRLINLGYFYARSQDTAAGISQDDPRSNLKVTNLSFAWPTLREISVVGLWSQNWNQHRLQNLIYGLQYDTCCWAVRLVGGKAFTHFQSPSKLTPQEGKFRAKYNTTFFIQISLKGLSNVGSDPSGILRNITGYNPQFGQET